MRIATETAGAMALPHTTPQGWLRRVRYRTGSAIALHRQRQALAALDARLLSDIGLSAEAAATEAARPFWDAPRHWRG